MAHGTLVGWVNIAAENEGFLWTAVLESAGVLGLERMLPRLVASKLPPRPFLHIANLASEGDSIKALAVHECRHDCGFQPDQCLTALVAEAEVQNMEGRPYQILRITAVPEGRILVELGPLEAHPYAQIDGDCLQAH